MHDPWCAAWCTAWCPAYRCTSAPSDSVLVQHTGTTQPEYRHGSAPVVPARRTGPDVQVCFHLAYRRKQIITVADITRRQPTCNHGAASPPKDTGDVILHPTMPMYRCR